MSIKKTAPSVVLKPLSKMGRNEVSSGIAATLAGMFGYNPREKKVRG